MMFTCAVTAPALLDRVACKQPLSRSRSRMLMMYCRRLELLIGDICFRDMLKLLVLAQGLW